MSDFIEVPADVFRVLFERWRAERPTAAESTSAFEDVPGSRYFIDGYGGYGIRPDGDLVFVHAWTRGRGDRIVMSALENGAETLDCFDGYLVGLYERHGFLSYAREANWTPGGPDVVFMATSERMIRGCPRNQTASV